MTRFSLTKGFLLVLGLSPLLEGGCVNQKEESEDGIEIPETPQNAVPARNSEKGILEIEVQLKTAGLLLNVDRVPGGAKLECDLDGKPLVPCHDGALFGLPKKGKHQISAVALKDGDVVAVGESKPFTVNPDSVGGGEEEDHPLALTPAMSDFKSGDTVATDQALTAKFKLKKKADCQVEIHCKYDSRSSSFWPVCGKGTSASFEVPAEQMASGLQFLAAQARCGDQVGPVKQIWWYGVPADYEPLMLKSVSDNKGRHIVSLVKGNDCPEEKQTYECSGTAEDGFSACDKGNVINDPPDGYQVRMACGDKTGPALIFGEEL